MPPRDDGPTLALRPLTISAPFGNYIQPAGCTATLGTYTTMDRPGRPWRVMKTVRYFPRIKAWVNQIGLRNPGIGWLRRKVGAGRVDVSDKLVSVHGFDDGQWWSLLDDIASLRPMAVELNMSCPNVGEIGCPKGLFERAIATGVATVVKLPPVNYLALAERAVGDGVRWLHCCNTLPVPSGGMSGRPLKPVALQCIRDLRGRAWMAGVSILGGGGIREADDIDDYAAAGADRFAVGSYVMNPALLITHRRVVPLRERAGAVVGALDRSADFEPSGDQPRPSPGPSQGEGGKKPDPTGGSTGAAAGLDWDTRDSRLPSPARSTDAGADR